MIPKCISSHNSGTITPPALQNFRYSENLYPREYLGLRAQRTVIKEIQKQVNSLPDDMPDKDAYNTINDVIKNILNSDFECLKQVSNDSIQSLKLCLAETKTTQLDKIGYFLLFSLLAIVKIFSYLSYYHELTLPNQNNDISQDRPDFSTSSSFDKEINIDQDTSSTSDYIVCRICEKQVPLSLIETHSKNCVLAFESSQTMISIDERLSKLSDHARQTILKRRPWPGNEMYSVNVIFPILHTLELIDRTISINTSSEFATEEIDLISEALIPITVRNNQEATDIIKKANTLVSEKFNTAFNYSRAISIVRRTSLSKDLPKINQPKISQFQFLKMISYGAFARVFLSKKIPTEDIYAIKVIPKTLLRQKNEVQRTLVERDILLKTDSPYMTKFCMFFILTHSLFDNI
ncbi:AGC family protein kinase [Histomonas meleagridis]|uniref:AGC family protein kinase n=1 Tax=Histomonas meleagridis TaxID=135588 RepID=UPI0035593822|nr:AGC family protein kinase [Histomonas meleagridis]KAH0805744.1 AGC family protein kinase [Histomonas meleagridis]